MVGNVHAGTTSAHITSKTKASYIALAPYTLHPRSPLKRNRCIQGRYSRKTKVATAAFTTMILSYTTAKLETIAWLPITSLEYVALAIENKMYTWHTWKMAHMEQGTWHTTRDTWHMKRETLRIVSYVYYTLHTAWRFSRTIVIW